MKLNIRWIYGKRLPSEFDAARSNIVLPIILAPTKANKTRSWRPFETRFRRFVEISGHDLDVFRRPEPRSAELLYKDN